jgi:lipopolysaccharide transport system ATP-binding protein
VAAGGWPAREAEVDIARVHQIGNGWARCARVAVCDAGGRPCRVFAQGDTASFFYEFEVERDIEVPTAGAEIVNDKGLIVFGKSTLEAGSDVPRPVPRGSRLRVRQDVELQLAPGEYTFNVGMGAMLERDYAQRAALTHAQLDARLTRVCLLPGVGELAVALRPVGPPVQLMHHGVANLPGACRMTLAGGPA